MNNRDYWQKREEEKLNKGIKDCNKLAKELEQYYKLANKYIEKEIPNMIQFELRKTKNIGGISYE